MSFALTLKHRVIIQQHGATKDAIGQPVPDDWSDVATVYADIRHQGGLESIKAGAETSIVKASIRIRYREGLNNRMRVLHGSTAYNIKAVLPDLVGKRHVDLVCEVVS